jgi:hypothetical protein
MDYRCRSQASLSNQPARQVEIVRFRTKEVAKGCPILLSCKVYCYYIPVLYLLRSPYLIFPCFSDRSCVVLLHCLSVDDSFVYRAYRVIRAVCLAFGVNRHRHFILNQTDRGEFRCSLPGLLVEKQIPFVEVRLSLHLEKLLFSMFYFHFEGTRIVPQRLDHVTRILLVCTFPFGAT